MALQTVDDIANLLHSECKTQGVNCTFNGKYLQLPLNAGQIQHLSAIGIEYDTENVQIDLDRKYNGTLIYYNTEDFVKRYKAKESLSEVKVLIINNGNSFKISTNEVPENGTIFNYDAYKRLLDFFLGAVNFIDYKNIASQEFVLISEKGPVQIGYNPLDERTLHLTNLPGTLERLISSFSNVEFQGFLKDAIIESITRFDRKDRFFQIISSLSILLDIADRDYQLYFKKFAFDKIKSKFKEERLKYFESIEKNIDNINKQVTAFPLTFSASAFASYQVKDKPIILILILLVYSLYTFVSWKMINLSRSNMNHVKQDVENEQNNIKENYEKAYNQFEPDFRKILQRIGYVNSVIRILKITLAVMLVLFLIFVIIQFLHKTPIAEPLKFMFI
jgi:hypothetical protein